MKVKTIQPHVYAERQRAIGDEYEMEERFYPPMSAMGHVMRMDETSLVSTRDLSPDPAKKYKRRDMRAQD